MCLTNASQKGTRVITGLRLSLSHLREAKKSTFISRNQSGEKNHYHARACIVKCVCIRIYIFNIIKKKRTQRLKKANETKEEKRISVENLTGYVDIVCEFALRTFNLLDQVVNFSGLFT